MRSSTFDRGIAGASISMGSGRYQGSPGGSLVSADGRERRPCCGSDRQRPLIVLVGVRISAPFRSRSRAFPEFPAGAETRSQPRAGKGGYPASNTLSSNVHCAPFTDSRAIPGPRILKTLARSLVGAINAAKCLLFWQWMGLAWKLILRPDPD